MHSDIRDMERILSGYETVCHFVFASMTEYYKVKVTFRANLYIDTSKWRWVRGSAC